MKERPIIFSGPMVRAILEGRKTQTRRVMKPQPLPEVKKYLKFGDDEWLPGTDDGVGGTQYWGDAQRRLRCPYGVPGDRLWVRETHKLWCIDGTSTIDDGYWKARYRADGFAGFLKDGSGWRVGWGNEDYSPIDLGCDEEPAKWRHSIHMPRWASRITLAVVSVRVERLQDISPEDAKAEGIPEYLYQLSDDQHTERELDAFRNKSTIENYCDLWDSLNAKRSFGWDANPWVWVIEFRRIENEDRQ